MNDAGGTGSAVWTDAVLAAALAAVDAAGLGGVRLRARAGPVRERWLAILRALGPDRPMPRLPLHADVDRLGGGLDLAATLQAGRPVAERGLLRQADGGLLLVAMAERLDPAMAATIAVAMETGHVHAAVSAASGGEPTRFGVIAFDEGAADDETTPSALAERLALHVDLGVVTVRDLGPPAFDSSATRLARARLSAVGAGDDAVETLCNAAAALGIGSLRAVWLALRCARASAALAGREQIAESDLAAAVRLVLAPRATTLPADADESEAHDEPPGETEQDDAPDAQPPETSETSTGDASQEHGAPEPPRDSPPDDNSDDNSDDDAGSSVDDLTERVLEAAQAWIPSGLLDDSRSARAGRGESGGGGKSGAMKSSGVRGRPAGVRRGRPGPDARLNLVETLRAAAPWQKLRATDAVADRPRVQVRLDDFRVTRFKQRRETTTVFVVDASGSAALHRLAEAKGAVELLLADCYVRRDRVALVTFRGRGAEVLLPPTRSLVQAKRRLAELPGGGGTPLATGLERALELGDGILRNGATPLIVVLTDGRANIAADGTPGREGAHRDALAAAARLRAAGLTVLLVDTSPRPRPAADELARALGARYIPLPQADAAHLSAAVRAQVT